MTCRWPDLRRVISHAPPTTSDILHGSTLMGVRRREFKCIRRQRYGVAAARARSNPSHGLERGRERSSRNPLGFGNTGGYRKPATELVTLMSDVISPMEPPP